MELKNLGFLDPGSDDPHLAIGTKVRVVAFNLQAEVDIIQKCRILGPQPKKRGNQKKQSHFLILAPPLFFWAPTQFFGPPMAFGALKSTLPPLLNAKLFRFGPL